jgi:hypothetical protein
VSVSWDVVRADRNHNGGIDSLSGLAPPGVSRLHETREYRSSPSAAGIHRGADHLLRLVRRMETANPKVVLDRLLEEWHETSDAVAMEELMVEKQLWAIVASENHILDRFHRSHTSESRHKVPSLCPSQSRNIIELGGSIGELNHARIANMSSADET